MAEQAKKRDGVLDLFKILATFCIIMHHYQQLTGAHWDGLNFWEDTHFYFGYLVELFFLISGIVIAPEIEKIRNGKSLGAFFGRRYLRFLPVVALSVITYEVLLLVFQSNTGAAFGGAELNWGGTLAAALSLQVWVFPNPMINNPVWYISALLLCYLIFYYLVKLSERLKIVKTEQLFVFMVLLGCAAVTYGYELPLLNQSAGRAYYAFFAGILLKQLMEVWKGKSRYIVSGIIFAGGTLALIFCPQITQAGVVNWYGTNLVLVYLYYPAMLLLFDNPLFVSLFSRSGTAFFAKISTGAFIWHHVIHTGFLMSMILGGQFYDTSAPVIIGLVLCADYLVGIISYCIIGKLFAHISDKIFYKADKAG
ncbi:MAG: acyltransferase [Lachnospiraceae bacterium]|nr:acyltransferase [Lachnospiraceae bacterium]